jgi:hypothetical protein
MRYKYFRFIRNENLFIVLLAIVIGVLSGLGAVGVRFLIRLFQELFFGGDGIARIGGFVVFVPGTRVNDEVTIRVTKVLRKYAFAEVVE